VGKRIIEGRERREVYKFFTNSGRRASIAQPASRLSLAGTALRARFVRAAVRPVLNEKRVLSVTNHEHIDSTPVSRVGGGWAAR
jgi:hypothetical protein